MPRVRQHRVASRAPSATRRILTNRDKPTYKVVLEEVTQKKKKLITVVCQAALLAFVFILVPDDR